MTRIGCTLGLLLGCAAVASPLRAADSAADAELLEYLGSVDSDEAGWQEYLAATDVDKLAKPGAPGRNAPAHPPPAPGTPPAPNASPVPTAPPKVKQP